MIPRALVVLFCAVICLLPAQTLSHNVKQRSIASRLHRTRRDTGYYLEEANKVDYRLEEVLQKLKNHVPVAVDSVEGDIAENNRNNAILALANLFGMLFGIAGASGGEVQFGNLTDGQQLGVVSQVLYGYGYWGPFVFALEDPQVDCGYADLDAVLEEYAFLLDMNGNYGYLNGYSGGNPYDQLSDSNDPTILKYYVVEFNHALKRAVYCIVCKKGGNDDALKVNTLIDLYTFLLEERLGMTGEALGGYGHGK